MVFSPLVLDVSRAAGFVEQPLCDAAVTVEATSLWPQLVLHIVDDVVEGPNSFRLSLREQSNLR
jgi:hypothetical protein